MARTAKGPAIADSALIMRAIGDSFRKLNPRTLMKNPVIFVTEVVALVVTLFLIRDLALGHPVKFTAQISAWLWFTVLFANFAEAIAEGRGRAQADTLRKTRTEDARQEAGDAGQHRIVQRRRGGRSRSRRSDPRRCR